MVPLPFHVVDVFGRVPLAGNPLAVIGDADDLSDAAGGRGAGIGGGLDGGHVAYDKRTDQPAADLVPAIELDIGGLQHGVGGFDKDHEALDFNHTQRFH